MPLSNTLIPITNVFTGGEPFAHLLLNSYTKQSTHSKDVYGSLALTFKCESSCSDISPCALRTISIAYRTLRSLWVLAGRQNGVRENPAHSRCKEIDFGMRNWDSWVVCL